MNKDTGWGTYLSDPARFADAVNAFGCNGEQLVTADDLQEVDTQIRGIHLPNFVRKIQGKTWNVSKHRDLAQKVAFGVNFAIIGVENQDTIDYAIPLRNMLYDVAEYEKQAVKIRKQVRKNAKG